MNKDPSRDTESPLLLLYEQKAAVVHAILHNEPTKIERPMSVEALANPYSILSNETRIATDPNSLEYQTIHRYLKGEDTDVYHLYAYGEQLRRGLTRVPYDMQDQLRRGIGPPDIADVIIMALAANTIFAHVQQGMSDGKNPAVTSRARELFSAVLMAATSSLLFRQGDDALERDDLMSMYYRMAGESAITEWSAVGMIHAMLMDRVGLQVVADQGNLTQEAFARHDRNFYNRPLNPEARHQLNVQTAEVIERLHLLKAYPVISFEVLGDQIGLPWDVAVAPPLGDLEGGYAEGAVADFIVLMPNEERSSLAFRIERTDHGGVVDIGDAAPIMRFRLHDDGRITHGMRYHNIPSNQTEEMFKEMGAEDAFLKLRGLFTALAFDAIVPDEAVPSEQIRGSVAQSFRRLAEQAPPQDRITKLLLRRRRALERAQVSPRNRQPSSWPRSYTRERRGYVMRMRDGYRARPTAKAEAEEWHRNHNLAFLGLQANETWVPEKDIPAQGPEVTQRRAYFRRNSETVRHLGAIGMPRLRLGDSPDEPGR